MSTITGGAVHPASRRQRVRGLAGTRRGGCHWTGTAAYWVRRCESHGYREWNYLRREDRRRSRRQARHDLRAWNDDD